MARTTSRPPPTATRPLQSLGRHCPICGATMWAASHHYRPITTLEDVGHLPLPMRRGLHRCGPPCRRPSRPEAAGRLALPGHACGLEVMAWGGTVRDAPQRRWPASQQHLRQRGVAVAPRTVRPRLDRDDALRTLSRTATVRLQRLTHAGGRVSLALDGLQPAVGHAGLWGLRDGLSGDVLRARRWLSAPQPDLAERLRTVRQTVQVPSVGRIADGHLALRGAGATVFPAVPPLCPCHDLREAAQPLYAADRQAKQALTKRVRGVRPSERRLAGRPALEAKVVRGDCAAVRSALTDAGRPP
jgi:hypothetical protein